MKKNLLIFCILFLVSCTKSSDIAKDTLIDLTHTEIIRYVSYSKQGDGSGNSPNNAADFLNTTFWEKANQLLMRNPVRVLFAEGNYSRAHTEKALIFKDMGNIQNKLTLEGVAGKTIFNVQESLNLPKKSVLFEIKNSQNIHVKNISFTGDGLIEYALRITSDGINTTKNILIENCSWIDMRGTELGSTGVHQKGTSHVTYLNCTFKRIGIDSHAHHIYNSYGATHVSIIDSHFEDCTGDFIRFRDNMDYGIVRGSTFIKNEGFENGRVFISVPLFNSRPPVGDEYFRTNFSFTNNTFTNNASANTANAITFYHMGFTPPEWNYLLTAAEGSTLQTGSITDKKALLLNNFGIDADKVRISGNTYSPKINTKVALLTYSGYGAESKGFDGLGDITNVVNSSVVPFSWEK